MGQALISNNNLTVKSILFGLKKQLVYIPTGSPVKAIKKNYHSDAISSLRRIIESNSKGLAAAVKAFNEVDEGADIVVKKTGATGEAADALQEKLSRVARVKTDKTDKSPGFKFAEQEMRGIPLRIEVGPRDLENNEAVVVRRDTGEKQTVSLDELETVIPALLDTIQKEMLERARAHRDEHTYTATDYETFKDTIENRPGFIKAMWCGDRACEDAIKEETGATARCMPFAQEHLADTCVYCGKEAKKMVYFGRAY